jgi:hypothetical protein
MFRELQYFTINARYKIFVNINNRIKIYCLLSDKGFFTRAFFNLYIWFGCYGELYRANEI